MASVHQLFAPAADISLTGRLVEISGEQGTCCTSLAASLVYQAQCEGEIVAWLQPALGSLYPPDLAASGIDITALIVVHIPEARDLPKAAEILLRSGGFGCVVLDFCDAAPPTFTAWQGRLLSLAREHQAKVFLLTHKASHADSLGPLVSLRIEPQRMRDAENFVIQPRVLKNKMGASIERIMPQQTFAVHL